MEGDILLWTLPEELLLQVLSNLDLSSVFQASLTCSYLYNLAGDDELWSVLTRRSLGCRLDEILHDLETLLPEHRLHEIHAKKLENLAEDKDDDQGSVKKQYDREQNIKMSQGREGKLMIFGL